MAASRAQPGAYSVWLSAARPRTLPLAVASIGMGAFLAASHQLLNWPVVILTLITALLLQILSNLANDYGDARHGADHAGRTGPKRAVQSGQISPRTMRVAIGLTALLCGISGLALLWVAFGADAVVLIAVFVLIGAAAIIAAVTYTAGWRPYGYAGLGDLAVFLFFGLVGVLGTYLLQTLQLQWPLLLPATSCGLLIVGVLNVNNIRDLESDKQAGKITIPVRLGPDRARNYHWLLLLGAVLTATVYVLITFQDFGGFLYLLSVPLLWRNGAIVSGSRDSIVLNGMLKQLSLTTLLFVLTFGIGQLL